MKKHLNTDEPAHTFPWRGSVCKVYLFDRHYGPYNITLIPEGHMKAYITARGCLLDEYYASRIYPKDTPMEFIESWFIRYIEYFIDNCELEEEI